MLFLVANISQWAISLHFPLFSRTVWESQTSFWWAKRERGSLFDIHIEGGYSEWTKWQKQVEKALGMPGWESPGKEGLLLMLLASSLLLCP